MNFEGAYFAGFERMRSRSLLVMEEGFRWLQGQDLTFRSSLKVELRGLEIYDWRFVITAVLN